MPRRSLTLHPTTPSDLPLGFEAGLYLAGKKKPFADVDTGQRLAGRILDKALDDFGVGEKTITASGTHRPYGGDPRRLIEWSETTTVAGQLDAHTLGMIMHTLARRVAERQGKGQTAPEVYITEMDVRTIPKPPAPPPPPKPAPIFRERVTRATGKTQTIYRDRSTGRFARKDAWSEAVAQRRRP